jgi:CDP-diacylglycerol pyrophosphatase
MSRWIVPTKSWTTGIARIIGIIGIIGIVGVITVLMVPALGANRNALRQIVQEQCVVHWTQQHDPAPCVQVTSGYAVLADLKGGAHFLLIPTRDISGIESPELLKPDAPNYFSAAWQARDRLASAVGHGVSRNTVGLAVNPVHARSQDQLHIHIECLRPDVFRALNEAADRITDAWSLLDIGAAHYEALRIAGEDLNANPFELLAHRTLGAGPAKTDHVIGDYTLVVAGMQFKSGPGFIVLAGAGPAGELLLDSTCAVAGA